MNTIIDNAALALHEEMDCANERIRMKFINKCDVSFEGEGYRTWLHDL